MMRNIKKKYLKFKKREFQKKKDQTKFCRNFSFPLIFSLFLKPFSPEKYLDLVSSPKNKVYRVLIKRTLHKLTRNYLKRGKT